MDIYILGSKGFVGSGICEFFNSKNIKIIEITRDNYKNFIGKRIDIFINANGSSKKRLAEENPKLDFDLNVISTLNSVFDFKPKFYIYLSTIDVYNNVALKPKETDVIIPEKLSNYGFDKYISEQIIKKYCNEWLILRLGGMVGKNLKKNSVFDILNLKKTFVSPNSEYQYINTFDVGRIIYELLKKEIKNDIFNICGDGTIKVEKIAKIANITLPKECYSLKTEKYDIDISKIKSITYVPRTLDTIKNFIKNYKKDENI
ncbi:MAG: NAD-dependent epimerase/dehydratase family protein [Candidatus Aenigmatarchaeota archaeon]